MTPTPTTTRPRRDASRGAAAVVGVLLLVFGVPALLISWVGWPLPTEVPTAEQVTDALRDTYIPDELIIKALAVVCWLVWVELVAALLVETAAHLSGRQAGPMPFTASGVQRAAARLVATCALLGALAATRGMPPIADRGLQPPPTTQLVIGQGVGDLAPAVEEPGPAAATPHQAANPVYEVQRRDTLWRIAECHLGDPMRWREIYELNRGLPQADGSALENPDLIYSGWVLQLPADASDLPASTATTAPAPDPPPTPSPPPAEDEWVVVPADQPAGDGMVLVDPRLVDTGARPGAPASPDPDPPTDLVAAGRDPASGDQSGMVLLPDGEVPAAEQPVPADDEWAVAGGDDSQP